MSGDFGSATHLVHTCDWMREKKTSAATHIRSEWDERKNERKKKSKPILPFEMRMSGSYVLVTGHFHRSHLNFKSYRLNSVLFDFKMAFWFFSESVKLKAAGAMWDISNY